jgi:hypothetical protein
VITASTRIVMTAAVAEWIGDDLDRTDWIASCVACHLSGAWGDLDADDRAANDHAVRCGEGRVLSVYELPADLACTTVEAQVWVITDDLEDPDTATTILWPSDYVRHEVL